MGESIRTIIDTRGEGRDGRGIRRGDAYVLNDPYRGGTHLPDITVIVPVFYGDEAEPVGLRRGARPPCRHRRDRAGIDAARQPVDRGGRRADRQSAAGRRGPFPRGGDARAARQRRRIRRAIPTATSPTCAPSSPPASAAPRRWSRPRAITAPDVVAAYMDHVLANAEESVRRLLDRLDDGEFAYEMDNGARVAVKISIDKAARSATFDFTGTSAQLPDNFNAPFSIVRAASLYVVRTLDRRCDPDERRLPAADQAGRSRRLDAQARAIPPRSSPAMSRPARSSPTPCSPRPAGSRRARGR